MKAMTLLQFGRGLVDPVETSTPMPGATEVLVKVLACGVCRTDLHVVDGELPNPRVPVIPGHEIVGRIERVGRDVTGLAPGMRIALADASFCFPLPNGYDDIHAAPLLCAGLIGYRALRMAGEGHAVAFTDSGRRPTSSPRSHDVRAVTCSRS